jgi:hypothetical protein
MSYQVVESTGNISQYTTSGQVVAGGRRRGGSAYQIYLRGWCNEPSAGRIQGTVRFEVLVAVTVKST